MRLDPEHALEEPRMAIRVPGEFHEASSRGQLCHRASRSPSYARPRHFPTRDEFISTAGHEPRDPAQPPPAKASQPPQPSTANQPPAPARKPTSPLATAGQDPATRADHRQPPAKASQPASRPQPTNRRHRPENQPPTSLPRYSALRETPCRAWEMLMRKSPIFSRASRMLR